MRVAVEMATEVVLEFGHTCDLGAGLGLAPLFSHKSGL